MPTSLQEQLLKAGLVKKDQVQKTARQQAKKRKGRAAPDGAEAKAAAAKRRAEQAARDRALAAERNAAAKARERRDQARQLIEAHRIARTGELEYAFPDGGRVKRLLVDAQQRAQLASGALVIVRLGRGYELLPQAAAARLRERDAALIVVDHAQGGDAAASSTVPGYEGFEVPDDLVW
ncbi:MAG: DUF2058 domain-containing protein [Gammaproteobacteria bacterium]|nr:DUF2058 domain-containing protein [Gammaproteobacteria bacterium]TVQ44329.1 MAG: DUF2058 domain-containing protein [Gammaproteobacteria bacterium]